MSCNRSEALFDCQPFLLDSLGSRSASLFSLPSACFGAIAGSLIPEDWGIDVDVPLLLGLEWRIEGAQRYRNPVEQLTLTA